MKKLKVARYGYGIISLLFCLAAIAYWLFPAVAPSVVCGVSGGILFTYGIIRVLSFFSEDLYCLAFRYDLACGLLLMVLGVVVWVNASSCYPYLAPGLGWVALLDSFLKVQMAKEAKDFGLKQWYILLIFAILTAFCSFLLVIKGSPGPRMATVMTGCTLLLEGVMNLVTVKLTVKDRKRSTYIDEENM